MGQRATPVDDLIFKNLESERLSPEVVDGEMLNPIHDPNNSSLFLPKQKKRKRKQASRVRLPQLTQSLDLKNSLHGSSGIRLSNKYTDFGAAHDRGRNFNQQCIGSMDWKGVSIQDSIHRGKQTDRVFLKLKTIDSKKDAKFAYKNDYKSP